jgi:arylsulfatase A-like enzyme
MKRAALFAALLGLSCRRDGELLVQLDLAAAAGAAERESPWQVVLFGTPSGISNQLAGFYAAPAHASADPFAWVERTAEVGLRWERVEPRTGLLDLAPFPGLETQSAEAFLNDKPLGTIEMRAGRARYRLEFPADAQRQGMNRLKLVFADTAAAVKAYRKRMSALLYGVATAGAADAALADLTETAPAVFSIEAGALSQSVPGAIRYVFRAPADAALRFTPALQGARGGGASATLRVSLAQATGGERVLWTKSLGLRDHDEVFVELPVSSGTLVRLSLSVEPGRFASARWRAPRVVGSASGDQLATLPRPPAPDPRAEPLRHALKDANVLYVILDAAGARHFSSYGYARRTTPEIDRIASEAVVFEDAYTTASFTLLAMSSAWTSSYPDQHHNGVGYNAPLPRDRLTLAELLGASGIPTAGFASNGLAGPGVALDRGFAHFDEVYRRLGSHAGAFRRVLPQWFEANRARRFFAYVHFREPHFAYDPPPPFNTLFGPDAPLTKAIKTKYDWVTDVNWGRIEPSSAEIEHLVRLYDGNLAYVDQEVGEIRRLMEAAGIWDRTLVIVSADHGDQLYEHAYIGHLDQVYEAALRIPLIVKFPKGAGPLPTRRRGFVDILDIAPTIADAFGVLGQGGSDREFLGRSLLPVALGAPGKEAVFARSAGEQPKYALRAGPLKLIYHTARDAGELFDLVADPDERNDLAASRPLEADYYRQTIRRFMLQMRRGPTAVASDATLSDAQRENLRALGYLP